LSPRSGQQGREFRESAKLLKIRVFARFATLLRVTHKTMLPQGAIRPVTEGTETTEDTEFFPVSVASVRSAFSVSRAKRASVRDRLSVPLPQAH